MVDWASSLTAMLRSPQQPEELLEWQTDYRISLTPRKADDDDDVGWWDNWNNLVGECRLQHKPTEEDD